MTVRIGLIGCGRIGAMHATMLADAPDLFTLVAVHDVFAEAAAEVAGGLGVPATATVEDLLDRDLDAVAICSTTETHADLIVAAAGAGRHVFCEKPISLDLAEVDRALGAARDAGIALQVGFNRRFDPSHRAVAEAVAGGSIGPVESIHITSRDPDPPPLEYLRSSGGIFRDMTVHDFDMARFVAGEEVVEVSAVGSALVDEQVSRAGDLDTVAVVLRFRSGAIGVIENSRRSAEGYDQRIEVRGAMGSRRSDNPDVGPAPEGLPFFLHRYEASYQAAWRAFAASIGEATAPQVGGVDGRASLVLGLAAARSVAERRTVSVDEVDS